MRPGAELSWKCPGSLGKLLPTFSEGIRWAGFSGCRRQPPNYCHQRTSQGSTSVQPGLRNPMTSQAFELRLHPHSLMLKAPPRCRSITLSQLVQNESLVAHPHAQVPEVKGWLLRPAIPLWQALVLA